jgi:hypothetical protein
MKYLNIVTAAAVATMATQMPAHAQQVPQVDLVGAGISVFNSIVNPPHRGAEVAAQAEIEKARINAKMELDREKMRIEATQPKDPASSVIGQWGATRIPCAPGAVFVNGINQDTVCISPTASIPPGYYNYSPNQNLLVKANGGGSQSAPKPGVTDGDNVASAKTTSRQLNDSNGGF